MEGNTNKIEDADAYGVIYKATSPSGKVYIGQTTRGLSHRINSHRHTFAKFLKAEKTAYTSNRFLMNAFNKYGFEAFTWEVIDKASSQEELDALEIKYIAEYKATDKRFGYNMRIGGQGGPMSDSAK